VRYGLDSNILINNFYRSYPVPGGNKCRNLALKVRRMSKIETTKYAHESRGTQI
jgi:hypothetical protein